MGLNYKQGEIESAEFNAIYFERGGSEMNEFLILFV